MNFESHDINLISRFLPNKEALYRVLVQKDNYLPDLTSKACTEEYLLGVARGQLYCLKNSQLRNYQLWKDLKKTKLELYHEIKSKVEKPLGFDLNGLPDKQYLINILYSIDSENRFFNNPVISNICRTLPEG